MGYLPYGKGITLAYLGSMRRAALRETADAIPVGLDSREKVVGQVSLFWHEELAADVLAGLNSFSSIQDSGSKRTCTKAHAVRKAHIHK